MEVRLLGPFEVSDAGQAFAIGGAVVLALVATATGMTMTRRRAVN